MAGCLARSGWGVRRWVVCSPKQRLRDSTSFIGACRRKASKKEVVTRPGILELAKYVIVFTTRSSGSGADVLRAYLMRWQIEPVFKVG